MFQCAITTQSIFRHCTDFLHKASHPSLPKLLVECCGFCVKYNQAHFLTSLVKPNLTSKSSMLFIQDQLPHSVDIPFSPVLFGLSPKNPRYLIVNISQIFKCFFPLHISPLGCVILHSVHPTFVYIWRASADPAGQHLLMWRSKRPPLTPEGLWHMLAYPITGHNAEVKPMWNKDMSQFYQWREIPWPS